MIQSNSPLAVVTGVSGRIGFALAERCASNGFDLLVASPDRDVTAVADRLRDQGVNVDPVRIDLESADGVDELYDIVRVLGRPVDALVAGAGAPLPDTVFLDQDFDPVADALEAGVVGPLRLTHRIGRDMRARGCGRILIAGAAARVDAAITRAANAFLAGFAVALRDELRATGVSVTMLLPQPRRHGAAETSGRVQASQDAKLGFEAMMRGELGLSPAGAAAATLVAGCVAEAPQPHLIAPEPKSFETSRSET